ncbi:protein FAR-RED ELONGATED HYPOCOTYL 3-like [Papaver somniferum]|uniref:protein FAR-RED ELONGATED HYPOCOTYL 3-like n=1 Tax=Papaver somniferum TaxID=3469 RepID=UPI000E6F75D2|nr:protein FAR-RED ELONGATED HYPOCOTYL 3-like [Papaver somniferum]
MFQRYKSLGKSKWLGDLYKDKEKWVPCFVKTYFWEGMSTTQRSESMNAFFDKYVTSKTSLKEFVEKYELALRDKIEKELKADAKSFFTIIPTKTHYEMEKQVRSIYINEKFLEFQMELLKKTYCEVIDVVGDSPVFTYHIQEEKWIPKPKEEENACLESTPENACLESNVLESIPETPSEDEKEKIMIRVIYKVSFQKDDCKFECSYHNFEFRGIVCRHVIMVLHRNDIFVLPEKYLLQRWRKDVKRLHTDIQYSSDAWKLTPKQKRYNELCNSFAVLADAASSNDVKFADIKKWIQAQLKVSNFNEESTCKLNATVETTNSPPIESKNIRNPPAAPKKGRPKENTPKAKVYTKNQEKKKKMQR